uniref:cytochrome P450 11C1 isoform X2 n=1 Tax=Pristiophorus japonicus TaxID=55135 RepID=UPI00398F8C03
MQVCFEVPYNLQGWGPRAGKWDEAGWLLGQMASFCAVNLTCFCVLDPRMGGLSTICDLTPTLCKAWGYLWCPCPGLLRVTTALSSCGGKFNACSLPGRAELGRVLLKAELSLVAHRNRGNMQRRWLVKRLGCKVWGLPVAGCPGTLGTGPGLPQDPPSQDQGSLPYRDIPSTGRSGWLNLYRLWRNNGFRTMHRVMTENFKRLGPIYREKLGRKESVNIIRPEDIAVLFLAEGKFPKREMLDPWVAHREHRGHRCGIFLKNGPEWRSERLVLNKEVISLAAVRKFAPFVEPVAQDFARHLARRLEAGGMAAPGIDIMPDLFRFALESSFHLLYGVRLRLFADQLNPASEQFIGALQEMLRTTLPLLYMPLEPAKRLGLKAWRDHVAAWDMLFQHAHQSIMQLRQRVKSDPADQPPYAGIITELLLHSKLPVDIITANGTELMVGSVDTTALSLLFTLFELARNPSVQEALRDEVTAAYEDARGDVDKLLHSVPLLRGAIKETLRLYPIGVTVQREPIRDIVLQNYHIPAGTMVQVGLYSLGRNADFFPEPERYDPARWLNSVRNQFQALSFGFGVRQCIGRRVAETEIGLSLIHILRRFQIFSNSSADVQVTYGFILMVDIPPLITFKPIHQQKQSLSTEAQDRSQLQA